MRVSYDWLRDYTKPSADVHEVAERLTKTFNEVDDVQSLVGLDQIKVGEVVAMEKHPDADNLQVTTTKVGGKKYQIICGAPNVAVGSKVAVALPGVTLPDGLTIEPRKIRGVVSQGMLCSPKELNISDDHAGILLLDASLRSGATLPDALGSSHDGFDLEVLANRPDCLGHLGIAREVAAGWGVNLAEPQPKKISPKKGRYTVKLQSKHALRYSLAHVTGLTNGPSPAWLQDRLAAAGMRPINLIVDITNYVMLEYAQPLHAVDAAKLGSKQISVADATVAMTVPTLDGQHRKVPAGTTLIRAGSDILGLAGIMGSAAHEVDAATTEIVLEVANFDAAHIRRSTRRLGLRTEASARFEKGISAAFVPPATQRALQLLTMLAGGKVQQLSDTYPKPTKALKITLDPVAASDFLGLTVTAAAAKKALTALGYAITAAGKNLKVVVPWWRSDVLLPVDLYEDLARVIGYETIPTTVPSGVLTQPVVPPTYYLREQLRQLLIGAGLTEIQTHSLVGKALVEKSSFPLAKLPAIANPLSTDHEYLRGSMAPRHLESVQDNLRWSDNLRFFEIGTVFESAGKGKPPAEQLKLLVTLATAKPVDLFADAKGVVSHLCRALRIPERDLSFQVGELSKFVAGSHFTLQVGTQKIGWLATYAQPKTFKAGAVQFVSINLDQLLQVQPSSSQIVEPPSHPPVWRDISAYVPAGSTYAELRERVQKSAGELLYAVAFADEYVQDQRRSIAINLEFRGGDRTLSSDDVDAVMRQVASRLESDGYQIR